MIGNFIFPLDYIIFVLASLVMLFCFWKGIIGSILGLLTWIGSIILTIYFYSDLSNFINSQLHKINLLKDYEQITNLLSIAIAIPLIFLISIFILKKFRKILSSDLDKQIFGILVDKFFGFLFGFVFNYIIFSTLIYCFNSFEFLNFINDWLRENSYKIVSLDNYNNNLLNYIIGGEETITN